MANYTVKPITDKKIWEDFLASYPESNFLQSWYWGEFHKNIKHKIYRIGFYEKNVLIGVMLGVIERAKRGTYLTVPGGPILDWDKKLLINNFVDQIKIIARSNNCVFVRVRPQLIKNPDSIALFKSLDFTDAPTHLHAESTSQLRLDKSEELLLQNMRKTTRYEIKKAQNMHIVVTKTNNPKEIKKFYELQLRTANRQGFIPFSYSYLYKQFIAFTKNNNVLLFSSYIGKKLLAQAIVLFYKNEAVYHYGASTIEARKYPGAYLLQWEAIREAKKRGCAHYNLWGVVPLTETKHRFYGVSVFKRGFGGEDVQYLHAQDLIINKVLYLFSFCIESIRSKLRHL